MPDSFVLCVLAVHQQLQDVADDASHQPSVGDAVAERQAHVAFLRAPGGDELEGERDRVLGFVQVGDVQDEGRRSPDVHEAERGARA